jgi:hypothetical protein
MQREVEEALKRVEASLADRVPMKSVDMRMLVTFIKAQGNQRWFPVMRFGVVPWWLGVAAHAAYMNKAKRPNSGIVVPMTSAEAAAQRGGFTTTEMDEFIPGWRLEAKPYVPTRKHYAEV